MGIIFLKRSTRTHNSFKKIMNETKIAPLTFSGVLHSDGTISVPEEIADFLQDYGGEVEITVSFKREVLHDEISDEEVVKISQRQKLEEQYVRVMMSGEGTIMLDSEVAKKLVRLTSVVSQ